MTEEQARSDAMLAMVLGLVGMFACQLTGPVALWFAWRHQRAAQALGLQTDPMAIVGGVLGAIGTAMLLFGVVVGVVYVAFFGFAFVLTFGMWFLAVVLAVLGAAVGA